MKPLSLAVALVAAASSFPALAQVDPGLLGAVGESCRARPDCRPGLACVGNVCRPEDREGLACGATSECGSVELRCLAQVCRRVTSGSPVAAAAPLAPPPPPPPAAAWPGDGAGPATVVSSPDPFEPEEDILSGTHWYVGGAPGFGVVGLSIPGYGTGGGLTAPLALRAGVWLGRLDLALDFSPATNLFIGSGVMPNIQLNVGVGYLAPFSRSTADFAMGWVVRGAIGFAALGIDAFQLRVQLLGIGVRSGHLGFEIGLPVSVYFGPIATAYSVPLTASFSYVF